jgi:putative Mg2+ transporter-C (MgtC) family protein
MAYEFTLEWEWQLRILLDVMIAAALGGFLGLEREKKNKPAGFRTNMLVAGGSSLLLVLGRYIAGDMQGPLNTESLGINPTRIIHAIIVGASFIGTGTIVKSPKEETIKYLTTAATILFSAGIGISVGLRLYIIAAGVTLIGLVINYLVSRIYG